MSITNERVLQVAAHHLKCAENNLTLVSPGTRVIEQEFVNVSTRRAARDGALRAQAVLELATGDIAEGMRERAHQIIRASADVGE